MGLKFRRGTNAQKSGSLAFGEPYVNTDLGTLQIGGLTGDITLGASGTGSAGSFSGISGSSIDITGNAKIDGNLTLGGTITIGDNSSDNVVVNADLSSSIIPNNDNSFDLGSTSFRYRAIHGTNIYGAINATNGVVSGSSQIVGILSSLNTFSASNGNTSLNSYTGSNDTTNTTQNTKLSRIEESTSSLNAFTASQNTKDSTLALYTASVDSKFTTLQTLTASMAAQVSRLQESTASLNAFTNSFNSAIQLTGSNVNIAGNLTIAGTTTTVNSTNVAIADAVIELNYGGAVVRGGILVKDGTGGSNVSGSLLWDGTNDQWIAGVSGSESKILRAGSDGVISGSSQVDITATTNYTTFSGSIASSISSSVAAATWTNISGKPSGLVSGSSQVVDILTSLNTFSASENSKSETLRLYTASVDTKFSTLATYTGSNDTTNTTQNTRLTRLEESTASLNAFTASQNTKNSTLALYTASVDTKFTTLQTLTASMAAQVSRIQESTASLNSYTSSNDTTNTTQNTRLSRIEESTSSLNAFSASQLVKDSTLQAYTASIDTKFSTLATYTGSNDTTNTTQNTRLSRIEESTSSLNAYTASNNTTNTLQTTRIDQLAAGTASVNLQTASVAGHITDINTYTSSLKTAFSVSGTDLTVIGNLTVQGDTVTLNVSNLLVEDKVIEIASGSTTSAAANGAGIFISGANASILWDNASSTLDINKSIDVVGNVTLTGTVDGVDVSVQDTLYTNKFSTLQTLTASMAAIDLRLQESTASLNAFSASENTKSETLRLYTASIDGKFSTLATYTGSNDTTNTTQNTRLTRIEESTASINLTTSSLATTYEGRATAAKTIFSGSSQVVGSAITTNTITIGSTSTALGGTSTTLAGLTSVSSTGFTGALTGNASTATTLQNARTINGTSFDGSANITIANLVSASAQIDHNATTNYVANRHIDHTAVSISAGNGLSGGGDISATRTLTLDTTSATFTTGVKSKLDADGVISGSRTISGITLGSNLATLTIGTGLSGTSYNGSTGVTIANTGVLSVTTNTGLSTNASATGNITITNTGVTSAVGTSNQISVSGATGAVTFSLPQSIATSSNVQFNSLGIGGAASGTAGRIDAWGDIVAFSTSDKNFKENITPIPNALEKISRISGNTYDWKVDMKEFHGFEGNDVGVIAQEIEEVLPQLVTTRENGYKAVKYDKLVALLIEGIKEQQTQIHSLTLEIEKLKESKGL